jgi:tetratricopeptide (TPR) repeat protein
VLYDSEVVDFLTDECVFTKVDINADTALARKYSILVTPTMVMLNADGSEVDRMGFFVDKSRFLKTFRDFRQGIGTLASLIKLADTGFSLQLGYDIGERYALRNDAESARQWYHRAIDQGKPSDSMVAECRVSMADIEYRRKNYTAAIAAYDSLATGFPGGYFEEMAIYYRGYMYKKMGDTAHSVGQWEDYLSKFPKGSMADYANEQRKALIPGDADKK